MEKTYNFKLQDYPREVSPELRGEYKDTRNGIVVIDPTFDLECYINYIDLLNAKRDSWINYGYLDMGMMPIAMAPSFMQEFVADIMLEMMDRLKVPCYNMPAVSLFYEKCAMHTDDLWVFKEDLAKAIGLPEDKITLATFLRRLV